MPHWVGRTLVFLAAASAGYLYFFAALDQINVTMGLISDEALGSGRPGFDRMLEWMSRSGFHEQTIWFLALQTVTIFLGSRTTYLAVLPGVLTYFGMMALVGGAMILSILGLVVLLASAPGILMLLTFALCAGLGVGAFALVEAVDDLLDELLPRWMRRA